MKMTILIFHFSLISISLLAQQNKILGDRPSNTIIPFTIPKNYVQTETGLHLSTIKLNITRRDRFFTHPQLLLKYGLLNNLELRVLTEFSSLYESNITTDYYVTGLSNFQVGAKYFIIDKEKWRPAIGIVAHYSFNTLQTLGFSKDTINGANFRFCFENDLAKNIVVVYNAGMIIKRFGGRNTYVYSISPRFTINEKFIYFIELYGNAWKKQAPHNTLHTGLSYFLNDNLKFDAAVGIGFKKIYTDRFYSIGASYRFKAKRSKD